MNVIKTSIPDVLIIEPKVFGDSRGYFFESYNQKEFEEKVGPITFVQDNESKSSYGVLRGLHFQKPPFAQAKLVRCAEGEVFDVAVDLRRSSPHFGRWVGEVISAENHKQILIPPGFAHGFLVLSESAEFLYKTTEYYAPEYERSLLWSDPELAIAWPLELGQTPLLAAKDAAALPLAQAECYA